MTTIQPERASERTPERRWIFRCRLTAGLGTRTETGWRSIGVDCCRKRGEPWRARWTLWFGRRPKDFLRSQSRPQASKKQRRKPAGLITSACDRSPATIAKTNRLRSFQRGRSELGVRHVFGLTMFAVFCVYIRVGLSILSAVGHGSTACRFVVRAFGRSLSNSGLIKPSGRAQPCARKPKGERAVSSRPE
ncbi:hypothetical protein ACVIGA_005499 [Bradyrhizobium sp. USDA 3240]